MLVTQQDYPKIVKAFHTIDEDSNGPRTIKLPAYDVPAGFGQYLRRIEDTLVKMSLTSPPPEETEPLPLHIKPDAYLDSEWFAFCCGEHDVVLAMAGRDVDHELAAVLLEEFFDDYTESNKTDPMQLALRRHVEFLEARGRVEDAIPFRSQLR